MRPAPLQYLVARSPEWIDEVPADPGLMGCQAEGDYGRLVCIRPLGHESGRFTPKARTYRGGHRFVRRDHLEAVERLRLLETLPDGQLLYARID